MENLSAYSDYSRIDFNIFNVSILFGSLENGNIVPMGKIKMSPQAAKALQEILTSNLKMYEEIYGPINVYDDEAKAKEKRNLEMLKEKQNDAAKGLKTEAASEELSEEVSSEE